MLLLSGAVFLTACSEKDDVPVENPRGEAIVLSGAAGVSGTVTRTPAVYPFPNDGSVGILASVYDQAILDGEGNVKIHWKSYDDILNAPATAVVREGTDTFYSFDWVTDDGKPKYWPFDGGKLVFMAYSPHTAGYSLYISLDTDSMKRMSFSLGPNVAFPGVPDIPDVMWASNNGLHTSYNKEVITETGGTYHSPPVELGEFQHALSQLTVEIAAGSDMNANIVITRLTVSTTQRTGVISLADGSVEFSEPSENPYTYTLISNDNGVAFKTQSFSRTMLLLPTTEDVTQISLTLRDLGDQSDNRYDYNYLVPFFPNVNDPSQTLKLVQGKNTTARILVESVGVQDPGVELDLKGVLSEWNQHGKFGVTIN